MSCRFVPFPLIPAFVTCPWPISVLRAHGCVLYAGGFFTYFVVLSVSLSVK